MRNYPVRFLALYAGLFREPGAKGFVGAGFVSRLTTSMVTVGLILAVTAQGWGYATAGVAVGALTLTSGVALPVFGRLFDRYGQRRVLVPMVLAFGALMLLLIAAIAAGAPSWLLVLLAAAAGAPMPVAGPLVRARWTRLYAGTPKLRTAYAFESATIEVVYIAGPILVTALATGIGWLAGLAAVVVCALGGTLALAAQRSTEPAPAGRAARARRNAGPLRMPALRSLYLARFCIGGVFGALPIATVAYATAHHDRAFSGLLLSSWGFTSMLAGLGYGALKGRAPLDRRLLVTVTLFAVGVLPLLAVRGTLTLAAALLLAGVAMAPITVSAMEVMQLVVSAAMLTETIAWDTTAIAFGMTAGSAVVGASAGAARGRPHLCRPGRLRAARADHDHRWRAAHSRQLCCGWPADRGPAECRSARSRALTGGGPSATVIASCAPQSGEAISGMPARKNLRIARDRMNGQTKFAERDNSHESC